MEKIILMERSLTFEEHVWGVDGTCHMAIRKDAKGVSFYWKHENNKFDHKKLHNIIFLTFALKPVKTVLWKMSFLAQDTVYIHTHKNDWLTLHILLYKKAVPRIFQDPCPTIITSFEKREGKNNSNKSHNFLIKHHYKRRVSSC